MRRQAADRRRRRRCRRVLAPSKTPMLRWPPGCWTRTLRYNGAYANELPPGKCWTSDTQGWRSASNALLWLCRRQQVTCMPRLSRHWKQRARPACRQTCSGEVSDGVTRSCTPALCAASGHSLRCSLRAAQSTVVWSNDECLVPLCAGMQLAMSCGAVIGVRLQGFSCAGLLRVMRQRYAEVLAQCHWGGSILNARWTLPWVMASAHAAHS
jgi:hypothetical protein